MFTYFVVKSYSRSPRGALVEEEPLQVLTSGHAVRLAERLAEARGGALAFSRCGSVETGEYEDAVVLATFGAVPGDEEPVVLAC